MSSSDPPILEDPLRRTASALTSAARRHRAVTAAGPPLSVDDATSGPDWLELHLARARRASEGGSYTNILVAGARRDAARVSAEATLAGWTFAVKDLIAVRGLPVGGGSAVRADAPPEGVDAPAVAALRAAGAVCVGTVTLHELAFGVTGRNDYAGTPINPHDPAAMIGGSSSGSAAAVAERSARVALGTDTGGSIRIPAALCGVVGFKPANDGRPPAGAFPLSPTLDRIGYAARSVTDAALAYAPLRPPPPAHDRPPVLGVLTDELARATTEVANAVETALGQLERDGCTLVEVEPPDPALVFSTSTAIMFAEAAAVHAGDVEECPERYGPDVLDRLRTGRKIPAPEYTAALERRDALRRRVADLFTGIDCLAGPTLAFAAPRREDAGDPGIAARLVANTRLANLVGTAAITLPLGAPGVALQIAAPTDEAALAAASWIEARLAS